MQVYMAYCGPRGIPLTRFLADDGDWDAMSRDAAIQWQARQSQTCSGCGTHPEEWDPARGGSRQAYVAKLEICPGCMARDRVAHGDQAKDAPHGARVALYRNT